jgi:hypothetical protein
LGRSCLIRPTQWLNYENLMKDATFDLPPLRLTLQERLERFGDFHGAKPQIYSQRDQQGATTSHGLLPHINSENAVRNPFCSIYRC